MTKTPKKTKQSKGGEARAASLNPAQRSEIAAAAARARWSRRDAKAAEEAMFGSAQGMPQPTPTPEPGTGSTFDARCGECSTVWVVAVLPMNLSEVAKLALKACCPACGSKKVFVSTGKTESAAKP